MMETRYTLLVKGVGSYSDTSLLRLFVTVFKHRLKHLLKGEGFQD